MNTYIYQAALFCETCEKAICRELDASGNAPSDPSDEYSYDSDVYPKGPYPDGGGEADSPNHCADCGVFLENPLTEEGYNYVIERVKDCYQSRHPSGNSEVVAEWRAFYDISLDTDESEEE